MIYRTQVRIIADVLSSIKGVNHNKNGIGVTAIIRKANLSHPRLMKILKDLVSSGLIEESFNGKIPKYKLSKQGEQFLLEYQKFNYFTNSFGLKL